MTLRILSLAFVALASLASSSWVTLADDESPRKVQVVVTLPHLAAHVRAIGGDKVDVEALARGDQDPHFVQPTPALMVKANEADLFVENGLELELWSERIIDGARNARIRVGAPGHLYAGHDVPLLEVPRVLSRSEGDIHPYGNPHVWLSPLNGIIEARNIATALAGVDGANAEYYKKRAAEYEAKILNAYAGEELVKLLGAETLVKLGLRGKLLDFLEEKTFKGEKLSKRAGGWLRTMLPFRRTKVVAYHREWPYFERDFGLEIAAHIEPKPGIPPTPGHLLEVKKLIVEEKIPLIIYAPFYRTSNFKALGAETGAKLVLLPTDVGGVREAKDYISLFDVMVDRLKSAMEEG